MRTCRRMNMLRTLLVATVIAGGAMLGTLSSAQAQSLVPCAREGGFCRVPCPTRVIDGVPGSGIELFGRGGGVACSNRTFGDPAPGVAKRCAFVSRGSDRSPRGYSDRGPRGREYDDVYRRPPRGYDRGFRDYDEGYDLPPRAYEVY